MVIRSCPKPFLARWVGIVSAVISPVSSGGTSTDCSSPDAYRHSTGYGSTTVASTIDSTTIDTTTISTTTIKAGAMNAAVKTTHATNTSASSICEGVSRDSRNAGDADDSGCSKRNDGST
jgi:hypothetical protein